MYDTWPIDIMHNLHTINTRQRRIISRYTVSKDSFIHPSGLLKKTLKLLDNNDKLIFFLNNIEFAYHFKFIITKCNSVRFDLLPVGTRLPAEFYYITCYSESNKRELIMPFCVVNEFFDDLINLLDFKLNTIFFNNLILYELQIYNYIATDIFIKKIAVILIQKYWKSYKKYIKNKHKIKYKDCMNEILYMPSRGIEYLNAYDNYLINSVSKLTII
jgi:hypothetical protein